MALFNYATKEITLKIVYYGPGLSGKTTNLQQLHSILDPSKTGKLLSLSTETDRTLFFDFLPFELGKIRDFSVRFQLYTVPGQVKYNATRKIVLKGADAVVFVADSQREMRDANIESFTNMRENLLSNNINPDDIPMFLQYNKRDLPDILSLDEMNKDLNSADQVYLEAEAVNGKGVQETFQTVTKLLLKDIARKHRLEIQPAAPEKPAPAEEEKTAPIIEWPPQIEEPQPSMPAIQPEFREDFVFPDAEPVEPVAPFDEKEPLEEAMPLERQEQPAVSAEEIIFKDKFFAAEEPVIEMPLQKFPEPSETREPASGTEERLMPETTQKILPEFLEKIDKMSESVREAIHLLINLKIETKKISEDLKKTKEEQKEILDTIGKLELLERTEKKKKKGWFR